MNLRVCPNNVCAAFVCATQQWLRPTSYTLVFHHLASASMSYISYHDVEKMGESEANDKSIRPGLSEMTSMTTDTTMPVTQVGNTIPPFVPQDTGALVLSPRNCMCDQINHKNSFVYRQDRREVTQEKRQHKWEKAGFLPIQKLWKNKRWRWRWTPCSQVCIYSTVEV